MKLQFYKKSYCILVGIFALLFYNAQVKAQTNLDFETGNLTGWTTANYGWSSNVATPVGFPTGGGTRVGKVVGGDDSWGGGGYEKLTQAFTVTSGNKDLTYRFKSYINNTYADAGSGSYHIRVYKTSDGTNYSNITGSSSTSNTVVLDLTACIGSSVTILFEVTAGWNSDVDAPTPAYIWVDASVASASVPPTAYAMTGGGSYCTGGAAVGLANSQAGVNYTLIKNGSNTATVVAGTGSAITFGSQLFGTYTASGTATGSVPAIAGTTAMTGSSVVTAQSNVTPTFTQLGPYCQNATPGTLPTTSLNSITGTWSPTTISTTSTGSTTYTFTPTGGQCATTTTMVVSVSGSVTPTFTQLGPYCVGATPGTLPTTSLNSISGTWNASISTASAGTTVFTFTPNSGGCATTATMSVTVNANVIPTFTQLGPYCQNATPGTLPTTSSNSPGITGTWNAPLSTASVGTTVYTFTHDAGQCATNTTMSVVVNANTTPTFTQLGPYCVGATPGNLPTTSLNSITGTWNASISTASAGTTVYTFTPSSGVCVTTATMSVVVNSNVTPTFTQLGPYLIGTTPGTLPTTSTNSITGTWNAAISTASAGTTEYTFTPTAGQCATTASMNVFVYANVTPAQSPPFQWADGIGGTGSGGSRGNCITTDASGNVYTVGGFSGTTPVDFDPGSGTSTLSTNGARDIFITKLDINGNFLWAKSFGGIYDDEATSVAVDGSGNAYVIGSFTNSVDFEGTVLNAEGGNGMFILKLDASGNFGWVQGIMGKDPLNNDGIYGKSMVLDGSGNIYVTGLFDAVTMDFNPASGSANEYLLSSLAQFGDGFIAKYDNSGNFVWAKRLRGNMIEDSYGITLDGSGNIYTTGYYMGTTNFNPGGTYNLSSVSNSYDIYVLKLSSSGAFLWAKSMGGTGGDKGLAITTDASGNVYTTGYYYGTSDFDPSASSSTLISNGSNDIFVSKLDASGNYVWAKGMGGTGDDEGLSITTDGSSNVFICGYYNGSADFEPTANNYYVLTAAGNSDIFVSKLDGSGNFDWSHSLGGTTDDKGTSIHLDVAGSILTTGYFGGTADFDASGSSYTLTAHGSSTDVFINKIGEFAATQWTGASNTSWTDSGNWSQGVPASGSPAIINTAAHQPTISTAVVVNEFTINSGAVVTVASTGSLTVNSTFTNNAGNAGLVIKSDASGTGSVIESNGVSAKVERYFSGKTLDWHLVSSPISNATAHVFLGKNLQSFDETSSLYSDITTSQTPLNAMEGYGLYSTIGVSNTSTFEGALNTGTKTKGYTVGSTGWNLVGNPYSSSLNWASVTIPEGLSSEVHYIDAANGADLSYVKNVGGTASQYIPPMQGFFIKATTPGTLTFTNASRTHTGANNFYKSTNPQLVVLEASGLGFSNQAWVYFNELAGVEHDGVYDAYKVLTTTNAALPQIYSVTPSGVKLSVNGMPETSSVPVGLIAGQAGVFTIKALQTGDFKAVSLEDAQTGSFTDLLTSSYSFTYTPGANDNRFVLHFSALSVPEMENSFANIYSYAHTVFVNLRDNVEGDIYVYNISGQMVAAIPSAKGSQKIALPNTGNYIVKLITAKTTLVKKVFIQ